MSMGRGRGRSNVPGQPPMQQQQQQQQQQMQQHQAAQDQGRRELRRPMQGVNPDDLARGMGRMDPFGNADYGNYGGGNGGGNSYGGHMMVPPPRPAPSADGWSSGENQYDVYDRQQQQQQHHHHQQQAGQDYMAAQQAAAAYAASQAAFNPQWNIGASEFVPKSNLSAAAAEFVPRVMARNTSQWGYQNQPQPQPQQQNYYQQPAQPVQSSYHQPAYRGGSSQVNPYLTGSGGSGASSLYNIEEQLSDSIATIVFMPSKLDRTATTMADKINSSANDLETLAGLANALIDRCFSEVSFQPLAGRFCATLAKNVTLNFEAGTMLSLLIERCHSLHASHLDWLSSDPDSAKFIVEFNAHLLYHLDVFGCHKVETLVDILFDMFNTLFTVGCGNPENLKTATDMLKICGRALENAEKRRNGDPNAPIDLIMSRPTPQVDQLMSVVAKFANDDEKFSESVRKEMKELLEARANNTWGTESCLPAMPAANEIVKPRSNAIVIEPDPNDLNTRGSNVGSGTNNVVLSNNARNTRNSALRGSEDLALTEEEMAFMNEHMAGNGSPGDSDLVGDRISISGDDEDDMPDEIRAAYEVFLQEQEDQQRRNGGNQAS